MAPAAAGRVEKRRGKRAAEEELDGERRLRKKFGRLRLGDGRAGVFFLGRKSGEFLQLLEANSLVDFYLSTDRLSEQALITPTTTTATAAGGGRYGLEAQRQADGREHAGSPSKYTSSRASSNGDGMQVDDTKTRVYITDLEDEIAQIEEEESRQTFKVMPEMEKQLMSIPKSVLTHKPKEERNNELVLYRVPAALGIPAEQDSVRAVMTDARERAREKMAETYNGQAEGDRTPLPDMAVDDEQLPGYDSDPMEIDDS
ncbi:uncharacterized protein ARB_06412 [Trichophyton benhamiae CBS 112371]|uniref:Uncharacterized protein n=1 Tax=Arthroderma benhamiae (strain ATCC MYA-4681 / CBS 112371) TaxID=663331 RepID=D4AQA5_ARTBC|nr:uncharacterized protein ARB_06412 [Trichophyton benhamiae CBS 112371]EFE34649.1 hypothetical protein ARB_06412 [Trichophyton benhamiae CBS 112371]